MTAVQRRYLIGLALAATVLAAVFAPEQAPPEMAAPAARVTSRAPQPRAVNAADPHVKLRYRTDAAPLFTATSWQPVRVATQPVRDTVAAAPAAPQPPPVPFRVLGKFVENGVAGVFVQLNDRTLVARAGDKLTEEYEVASISDQTMTVRYLPLNVTQDVSAGGTP
jgi:hypothetical protein